MHTFYEAVGYMIAASTDEQQQEQLIEKYMLLPNQVWDDIITQVITPRNMHCPMAMTCDFFARWIFRQVAYVFWFFPIDKNPVLGKL